MNRGWTARRIALKWPLRFTLKWHRGRLSRTRVLVGIAAAVVGLVTPAALAALPSTPSLPPGCTTHRAVVAFHSDGITGAAKPGTYPFSCAVKTGFGGAESRIAVAPNGHVLETPAVVEPGLLGTPLPGGYLPGAPRPDFVFTQNSGIGWTANRGASWKLIRPGDGLCPQGDDDLYFDRVTGRLFYSCIFASFPAPLQNYSAFYASGAQLFSSPRSPGGFTRWESNTLYGYLSENPRFTTAPAPAGYTKPVPGENMAYWCANVLRAGAFVRSCHRSFDGGASWEFASVVQSSPVAKHGQCSGGEGGDFPQGASDGSLWVLITCGANNFIGRSRDEARTWPLVMKKDHSGPVTIPGTPRFLRVDTAGTLYTFELDGNKLLLRTSLDGGQTWRGPFNMTAPGARTRSVFQWGAAIGYQPGQVAVSYLVARPSGGYDGYISVTRNGRGTNPVFYASTANPKSAPIITAPHLNDDFITLDVGPDGTPWAGFYSDCVKKADGSWNDNFCAQTKGLDIVPFVPPLVRGGAHAMTIASLQWAS